MVTISGYVALVSALIAVGGLIWKGGEWREKAKEREREVSDVQGDLEEIEAEMATTEDISDIRSDIKAIKRTIIAVHDEQEALRRLFLNGDDIEDIEVPRSDGGPVYEQSEWGDIDPTEQDAGD